MPRIRKLPPEIVHRIAAGEVVERPASVVKELIENSIDAGATEVWTDVEEGGIRRITVRDNGSGMDPEDLVLAFESHATSKLRPEDFEASLFGVATLGFRGEALPSIGSVADVEAVSRPLGAEHAYRYRPGRGDPEPAAGEMGTVVEVRNLFYNVPARRKFLRRAPVELSHVIQQVTRIGLAHPGISFQVTAGGKRCLELGACDAERERLEQVLGREKARNFLEVRPSPAEDDPTVHGFISSPRLRRGDARMQNFFVNGRWVRDRLLSSALRAAYQGFLIPGNHPLAYVFLEFPPDAVDANVHPTKSEVRYRDPGRIYPAVFHALRRTLEFRDPAAVGAPGLAGAEEPAGRSEPAVGPKPDPAGVEGAPEELARMRQAALEFLERPAASRPARPGPPWVRSGPEAAAETPAPAAQEARAPPAAGGAELRRAGGSPRRTFQILNAYILVEEPDGIRLIDQHALHEKILFEDFLAKLVAGEMVEQRLMVPEVVSLAPEQVPLIEEARGLLASCGYDVEPFGERELAIHAVPQVFERNGRRGSAAEVVLEVFEWLAGDAKRSREGAGARTPDVIRDRYRSLASLMACKSAVKAGSALSSEEIESLLARAELADDARHCPHGRPTTVRLTVDELERKFDRR